MPQHFHRQNAFGSCSIAVPEVNAANALGATALMWGTGDAAKVRLLLERGASVNAKTKDGVTALVTAARRGNLESVRTLLARGADPKAPELIRIAFATTNPALRDLLSDAGVKWRNPGGPWSDSRFGTERPKANARVPGFGR